MQTPEQQLSALLAAAGAFWEGRSGDSAPFDLVMTEAEPFARLCRACGYEAAEVTDGLVRWLETHPGPFDAH